MPASVGATARSDTLLARIGVGRSEGRVRETPCLMASRERESLLSELALLLASLIVKLFFLLAAMLPAVSKLELAVF